MTTQQPTITIGDEVIYPASNPRSGFLLRVVTLDDEGFALAQPITGETPLKIRISDLRLNRTEGS